MFEIHWLITAITSHLHSSSVGKVSDFHVHVSHNFLAVYSSRLYSGRAEHFWTKGAPNWTKNFLVLQYMKKFRSSPSEYFLVIRVCQKWQKCKISEKPGFWRNCGYISKTVRSIIMIFWHKTPLTINKRLAKKKFKIFFHFWETTNFAKIEISQKPVFLFFWNSKLRDL